MKGEPRDMQSDPQYDDVVSEVCAFLEQRALVCIEAGITPSELVIDPGFGFGKSVRHNLELLRGLPILAELGYPLLTGLSRKSMLGAITGRPADQRLAASVAAAILAVQNGASIIRVHDVVETADALKVLAALGNAW
jgi:dihydropteroate synthase